jgi:K+-sensing histidine kinase KdpD
VHELEHSREQIDQHTFLQEKLAMIITHDLQSPLRFLSGVSRRLNVMAREYHLQDITEMSSDIQRSSASIHHFVQDFGFWLKALGRDFRIQSTPVALTEIVMELRDFFPELLKLKGNTFQVISEKPVVVMADRQLILITLRNLIDNSNKYTEHGDISMKIESINNKVTISITDTGKGIMAEKVNWLLRLINDPYSSYYQDECSGGYGYRFIAVFCQLLHVNMNITSELGKGTQVVISNLREANFD